MLCTTDDGRRAPSSQSFFFNDTATTEIYTLSLHDALPIWACTGCRACTEYCAHGVEPAAILDRKSTRLNSSHEWNSYAVFCLKKKIDQDDPGRLESLKQEDWPPPAPWGPE